MTIEFDCPACAVAIRVPDNAAGKMGKCPQCATRLFVPRPQRQEPIPASPPPSATTRPALPESQPAETFPASSAAGTLALDFASSTSAIGEFPQTATVTPSKFTRTRQKRRKTSILSWLIPLVCLTIFGGALYWLVGMPFLPQKLEGELTATTPDEAAGMAVIIPTSQLSSDVETAKKALDILTTEPVILSSGLLRVSFEGTPQGLKVVLDHGPETVLYQVDLSQQAPLKEFITRQQQKLDGDRAKRQAQALKRFTSAILKSSGTQQEFASFRDELGLTASVKGVGYSVVAESGRTLYPCVAQPNDQTLVFALPRGLTEFQILGRPVGEPPQPLVEVNYRVKVLASAPASSSDGEKTLPEASDLPEDAPSAETKADTTAKPPVTP